MKTIVILFLGAFLCNALAEPLRYRIQQVRTSARQTDAGGVAVQASSGENAPEINNNQNTQNDEGNPEQITEPSFTLNVPPPGYYPQGWRPFGQLLVLPVAVRENENLESTTTVESSTFNDAETTEETPTTTALPTNGQLQEVETSEPKEKKTAAHKRPTVIIIKGKKIGELKLETTEEVKEKPKKDSKDESKEEESPETNESDDTTTKNADDTTTENADEATTTDPTSENLETTSEPDSEAVDAEKSNEEGKQLTNTQDANQPQLPGQQTGFFIQLPDGSFQRIVYVTPQTQSPNAFIPQPANNQIQQLNQAPNYPFGFNPISNPRIVTFSTQYNAW